MLTPNTSVNRTRHRHKESAMPGEIHCVRDGGIATVTLSNPAKRNAINVAMWESLAETFHDLSAEPDLRCVIVRGEGEHFASGGDIEEFAEVRATREAGIAFHEVTVAGGLRAIDRCVHPTIAMIRGWCIGGGLEIAAQCDLRIGSQSARLGAPIGRLGFAMAHTELTGLVALAGRAVMLELLLEGRLFDAEEAQRKGLLNRVLPDGELERETLATAQRIAEGAPLVARAHKKLVRRLSAAVPPLTAAEIAENFAYFDTEDYRAGHDAFVNKKRPQFTGR
jgi:enoyl-CoA hydratase/carnithine racemase